ncbi:MAG: ATP-binding protein, partial [Myxococcota bacterium]
QGPGVAETHAPRLPLEAIVTSLVCRAAEAMPEGGRITLTTANHESAGGDPAVMQAVAPARYVTLSVAESSGALDADALDRVFVPSESGPTQISEADGGLPLAAVYRLLQRVGGDLSVEVEPGRGSRFVAFLPLTGEPPQREAQPPRDPLAAASAPGH